MPGAIRRGRRDVAIDLFERAGGLGLLLRMRARRPSPWLTVLTYHRVADPAEEPAVDVEVIDATPAQFDQQVAYLTRNYNVIGIDDMLMYSRTGKLPPNSVLITFDDGYRDCVHAALPILQRHGARAVFFIATAYPEGERLFWWDRIAYLVRGSRRSSIRLRYPTELTIELLPDRLEAVKRVLAIAKRVPNIDFDRFVDELAEATGTPWSRELEREMASRLIMTWDDVRALVEAGMDVESHTRTHRILGHLTSSQAAWELHGSREDLRARLGYRPRALAYPVGKTLVDRPEILRAVRDAGYSLGYTNCSGSNDTRRRFDPLDVARVGMDVAMSGPLFRGVVAMPPLGYSSWSVARARRFLLG